MLDLSLLQKLDLNIINIDFCQLDRSWNYTNVQGPFSRLYLVTGGEGYVYHHNQKYPLTSGVMHMVPGFTLSAYHCDKYLEQYYLHFSNEIRGQHEIFTADTCEYHVKSGLTELNLFKRLLKLNPAKALQEYDPEKYDRKTQLIRSQQPDSNYTLAAFLESKGILMQLLSRFLGTPAAIAPSHDNRAFQRLRMVIQFIDNHLEKKITVEQLSKICHLHPDHFSKLFLKTIGIRPIEYICRKRIQKIQLLLLTSNMSLTDISRATGFIDAAYLSRVFKKQMNQTPAQYRKQRFIWV